MKENTLESMIQAKIKFQIGRVKWLVNEEGLTLDDAVKEARSSSTFSDKIWDEIKAKAAE